MFSWKYLLNDQNEAHLGTKLTVFFKTTVLRLLNQEIKQERALPLALLALSVNLSTGFVYKTYNQNRNINLQKLPKPGKRDILLQETNRCKRAIIRLSETHLPGDSKEQIGEHLVWQNRWKTRPRSRLFAVGNGKKSPVSVVSVSKRQKKIRLKSKFSNLYLVQVHTLESSRLEEESEGLYSQPQSLVDIIPKKNFVIVLGDFNAILGNDKSGNECIMGKIKIGQINCRGEQIIEFCRRQRPLCNKHKFKHR
ncbi:hypothetical protein QYM36_010330 [Artemia franciscana]|uniref:Endonuclease/exonuclease/phosphatase domain-containing protein n=1 Tax=Artemia franciscana TaxID=6661 RepID=A0AA88HTX6_ARTSF|nr:hypothetical protein QYM36_010330 [Artemia franciscana]